MSSNYSFEKSLRLLTKNDFQNLRSGSRFFISDILIFFVKANSFGRDRIGLAISKKYGNAIKRNKAKRLVREAFRHEKINFSSIDIIISMNLKKIKSANINHCAVESRIKKSIEAAYEKQFFK